MQKIVIVALLCLCYTAAFTQNLRASIKKKHQLIIKKMENMGLNSANISIISAERSEAFNKLLPLSAKNSYHLHGLAIDYLVGDINGDKKSNEKDVEEFCKVVRLVEKKYPNLVGGLGTYKNSWYARNMVHVDTRGFYAQWNK